MLSKKNLDQMTKAELFAETHSCGYPLYKMYGQARGGEGFSEMDLFCPNCRVWLHFKNGERKEVPP